LKVPEGGPPDGDYGPEHTAGEVFDDSDPGDVLGGLDASGFWGASACPALPTVQVMGQVIDLGADKFCYFLGIGAQLVLAFAYFQAARIIGRA